MAFALRHWSHMLLVACLFLVFLAPADARIPTRYYDPESQQVLAQPNLNENPIFKPEAQSGSAFGASPDSAHRKEADQSIYDDFLFALETMQTRFFEVWLGIWPSTIDWTGAVMGTHISGALSTMSRTSAYRFSSTPDLPSENMINRYFSQLTAYYFRENAFAIRLQAHDDMLWVVLGWLEGIKFINMHNDLHRPGPATHGDESTWHGGQFGHAFAHRARIFYDIVADAWDTTLCGGGLTWNPNLGPYKNTITNTLFVSAAVGMYLHHPGDRNRCPFTLINDGDRTCQDGTEGNLPYTEPHDPAYLRTAITAYDWLVNVNLLDADGLFVDGYHIHNYGRNGSIGTGRCDERNEMVYTYNQGVILSGLRDLWEATGNVSYLVDGHQLLRNVIRATGWNGTNLAAFSAPTTTTRAYSTAAHTRLGTAGILTEFCDPRAACSQDAQTFKGIFFHHFAAFCLPLPTMVPRLPGRSYLADQDTALLHRRSCQAYAPWVERNARAALSSRGPRGVFGGWWGAKGEGAQEALERALPGGAVDWRNEGQDDGGAGAARDVNDRGRGRTVETQGGGLAVLRALWELVTAYGD